MTPWEIHTAKELCKDSGGRAETKYREDNSEKYIICEDGSEHVITRYVIKK